MYFGDPYASYQRVANENANGLLRQYVPKGTDFSTVTHKQVKAYQAPEPATENKAWVRSAGGYF